MGRPDSHWRSPASLREDLVLPRDADFSANYALLQISEPKTRFRTARHQVAKLDQPQLLALVALAFGKLNAGQRLWPFSGQTMRGRFQKLATANKLDRLPKGLSRGLDLGSLRAGGASWIMMVSDNIDMIRRRDRWVNMKVMERTASGYCHYAQTLTSIAPLYAQLPVVK